MKKIMVIVTIAIGAMMVSGCGKSVDVEGRGMYANANTGVIGIGEFEVITNPEGKEAARLVFDEDTAWLSPSTKTLDMKANLYGTNSCLYAWKIVKEVCGVVKGNRDGKDGTNGTNGTNGTAGTDGTDGTEAKE